MKASAVGDENQQFEDAFVLFAQGAKYGATGHLTAVQRVFGMWGTEPDHELSLSDSLSQRTRMRRSRPGFTPAVREAVHVAHRGLCLYCGAPGSEIDHILARAHGGSDLDPNLALACYLCNRDKRAKTIWEWLRDRPDLDERAIRARWLEARGDIPLPGLPK